LINGDCSSDFRCNGGERKVNNEEEDEEEEEEAPSLRGAVV